MRSTTLNKIDHPYNRALKEHATEFSEVLLGKLFYALQIARDKDIETDHSVSTPNIRTLAIGQVQSLMHIHCQVVYKRGAIVEALKSLKQPKALDAKECQLTSAIDGDIINGIRLHYDDMPVGYDELGRREVTEDIEAELSQVDFIEPQSDEVDKRDASRRWIDYAMILEQQYVVDKKTIANLRAVITELSEVLYEVDTEARISFTSSELLELMQSNEDAVDTPF